ncbi:unnamed protein product [Prunus brigantina]
MCRPSQTPHLTMSSARIGRREAGLGSKKRGDAPPPFHGISGCSTPGESPRRNAPSPSPGRHAATRSRRGSSSSSPPTADGFGTGTPVPSPQSQSFSRGYGSILPTSLAYIVPSTRGCSPWRPDAVMSTTGREWHSVLRIFKGRRGRTGHHATCGALPAAGPYLRLSRFQGGQAICTDGRSARARAPGFAATAAPSYSSGPGTCPDGRVSAQLGTVTRLPVHPASPVLLTKNGPLGALDSMARLNKAAAPSYLFKSFAPIPKSDERFARQYRCGPPPEFPLASPRSGIVHHLSGPDRHALTRTLLRRSRSVGGATLKGIPPVSFLTPYGFNRPLTRTHVRLLGPCFKTGRMGSPQADARSTQMPRHAETARAAYHDRVDGVSAGISTARALAAAAIRIGQRPEPIGGPACDRSTSDRGASPAPIRFPPDNFKHSLTLFSKSFSSFPRGTCLLSVSRPYLALDRIYRPIGAAFPNNPTRRQRLVVRQGPGTTGLSPSPAPPSSGLGPGPPLRTLLQTTIRTPWAPDSQAGLFPVRSPLLGESLQACPRPNGFGRNLRSKTRWFTGFCNSHQVSHFATFFIDARAEISVAESRFDIFEDDDAARAHRFRGDGDALSRSSSLAQFAPVFVFFDNDPSAGSPTETLLRLLLPLNDKVQWTSRDVAGSEPPTSPRSEHFTGPFNRQIAPPTKNGHAPPPIESRKSSQSVNPYYVWTCTGGTTRPIKARSVSPVEGTSRPVHTRGGPVDPTQDLPSNGSSLRDLDCTHSNYQTLRARINQVAFLSDVGSVRDKRPCGSSARRGHDSRTCRAKTLPIGRSEARRPHARSMLRIRDHKQKLVDLHNLTTSRGLIGTQALLRCPPAAREGQEEERDNERHHSLTIGSQNRNPLTRTSQS